MQLAPQAVARGGRLRGKVLRSALSLAAVGVATLASVLIHAEWDAIAFEPLVGAVVLVGLLAGPRTAALAAVLAALSSITLVVPPAFTFETGDPSVRAEWLTMLAVLPLVIALAYVVRRARDTALARVAERDALRREERRARDRLAFLADAGSRLSSSLELEHMVEQIGSLAVPALGDWFTVEIVEGGRLRNLTLAHADPERLEEVRRVTRSAPMDIDSPFVEARAARSGEPVVLEQVSDADLVAAARTPEELAQMREVGYRSLLAVPLRAHDRVLGTMTFVRAGAGPPYGPDDVDLAEELADRVAVALDNAMLHGAERDARAREEVLRRILALGVRGGATAEIAGEILGETLRFLGAAAGYVAVVDERRELHRTLAQTGYSPEIAERYREVRLDTPVAGIAVARTGVPLWADSREHLDAIGADLHFDTGEESHAIVPLVAEGETIGAIGFSFDRAYRFSPETRSLLTAIADQCSQVIRRALTEEGRQRLARQVVTLHELSELAIAADSLPVFLDRAVATLQTLIDSDSASILLLDEHAQALVLHATVGLDRRTDGPVEIQLGHGFSGRVALARQPLVLEDTAGFPIHDERLRASLRALIGFPLLVRGRLVGVMHVGFAQTRRFTAQEVAIVGLAAERLAVAVQHAREVQRERGIAEILQRSLLPDVLPDTDGWELAGSYEPGAVDAQIGGDWYDAFRLADGRLAIVIGDVVGKGVEAAALMGQVCNGIRAYALADPDPGSVLEHVNTLMAHSSPSMATCFYGVLDPGRGTLAFAQAGHPPPLLRRAGGAVETLQGGRTLPLGIAVPLPVEAAHVELGPGDVLALYTDGLVERRGEAIEAGLQRLEAALPAPGEALAAAAARIQVDVDEATRAPDDRALLLVRRAAVAARLSLDIVAPEASLSAFRGELRSWLRRAGVGAREEQEILLTTGEAVANAVMHGAVSAERPVRVRLAAEGGEVRVRVAGGGPFRGRTPLPGRGWGIPIMERFADEVRIDPDDGGTAVELVHRLPVAAVAVAPGAADGAAR